MNQSTLEKKIKYWEDQLLDLGKRNRMISFRESKRTTLSLLTPDFHDLYHRIVEQEQELTFQKSIDRDSDVRLYAILALMDKLSAPIDVRIGDIRAEGSLTEIQKTLKNMRAKAKLAMDEQGTNILYLVFGFVQWHERGSHGAGAVRSPLLLVPVTLKPNGLNGQYTLKKHEDEIVVNPTLAYLFQRDYAITLPDFDADKDTLEGFLTKMDALVENRGWRILRQCCMGLVSFLKISMYNDLIRHEEQLRQNPIVRAFAGERNQVNTSQAAAEDFDHDAERAADSCQVLNADSSQLDAIALSRKGVSFVMQGPPGTGKSQTIANIIGQALADGKKILFVSEKMAALDVVYRRLMDVQLADFCLPLHSHKANKREILTQLGNNLSLQRIKVKSDEIAKLTRLDMLKEQLKAYVKDIHTTIAPLEMSLYEVYGAIAELSKLPDIPLSISNVERMNKDQVNRLALLVRDLDSAQGVLGSQWYKNPWQGITLGYQDAGQKYALREKLQTAVRLLGNLEECRLGQTTLAEILTPAELEAFAGLYQNALHCAEIPQAWFSETLDTHENTIGSLCRQREQICRMQEALAAEFDPEIFEYRGEELLGSFTQLISDAGQVLHPGTSGDYSFSLLDRDLQTLEAQQLLLQGLQDKYALLADAYELRKSCDLEALQAIAGLCSAASGGRKLTAQYFGEDNLADLRQQVQKVREAICLLEQMRGQVLARYQPELLQQPDLEGVANATAEAMEIAAEYLPDHARGYSDFRIISGIPMAELEADHNILTDGSLVAIAAQLGLVPPAELAAIRCQAEALESLPKVRAAQAWRSEAGRSASRALILQAAEHHSRLLDAGRRLSQWLDNTGLKVTTQQMDESWLEKINQAHRPFPEDRYLMAAAGAVDAEQLLAKVKSNLEKWNSLRADVDQNQQEFGLTPGIAPRQLLAKLKGLRGGAASVPPSVRWIDEMQAAQALLTGIVQVCGELRNLYDEITLSYEDSVFDLDYQGMLDRFKADYTGVFRSFKRSYQEDLRQLRLCSKELRRKWKDDQIVSLLQSLRSYHGLMKQYQGFAGQAANLLDIWDYDVHYDWTGVQTRLEVFRSACELFANEETAYRFLSGKTWDLVMDPLKMLVELEDWFACQTYGKAYFGEWYQGTDTDISGLEKWMDHAREMKRLFRSQQDYLRFQESAGDAAFEQALGDAGQVIVLRKWFAEKRQELEDAAGVQLSGEASTWPSLLRELEDYEKIAQVFGDQACYALVTDFRENRETIADYYVYLQRFAALQTHLQKADLAEYAEHQPLQELIPAMKKLVQAATAVCRGYGFAQRFCQEANGVTPEELSADLTRGAQCQRLIIHGFPKLDAYAAGLLGPDYRGTDTDWALIDGNVEFAGRVNGWLKSLARNDRLPENVIRCILDGTEIYPREQLQSLQKQISQAEAYLGEFGDIQSSLEENLQTLARNLHLLRRAVAERNSITRYALHPCTYFSITESLQALVGLQQRQSQFLSQVEQAREAMPELCLCADTDWTALEGVFDHLKQLKRALRENKLHPDIAAWLTRQIDVPLQMYQEVMEALAAFAPELFEITGMFEKSRILEGYSFQRLRKRLQNCLDQFDTLDAWMDIRHRKKACHEQGLKDFLLMAEDAFYPQGQLSNVFMKAFYYAWFEKVCPIMPSVADFRVAVQSDRVRTFRELDAHQLPVDQMRIREKLISQMPQKNATGRTADEMSILLHELGKKRAIMPLRKLFRSIPNLLLRLKPCLMMSPLSVSYFLEADTYRFDMVIFDEASQIFPQDAIGAIFRGAQVIIAGDSKQLPPTNFFAASTNNEDLPDPDDDEQEQIVFDSILEEAADSLPNRSLLWHYRSRFEELIAFSNQQIYNHDLITFPSSTVRIPDTGVEYVYVPQGIYENRCNRAEALRIVELVAGHIRSHPDRSLGVIAFSEAQQGLIEDEITAFRTRNPMYESFFDENREEPFFVKNLENVQGDERDTILFSVCYGKNREGRMYMRFGPLGHGGGERRLNVAITRAKHNVKLVGSILPEDIDLNKSKSEGVRMLRTYIRFAMQGSDVLPKNEQKHNLYDVDVFSREVGEFLKRNGCRIATNVGTSDYTIDIAVEHPKRPGHYIAGIECDGNSYYMARTVRDRDHLRSAVLERMGWKMYRVWSTEWIRNPVAEQERLLSFLRDALQNYGQTAKELPEQISQKVGTETVAPGSGVSKPEFPTYVEGRWWRITTRRGRDSASRTADMIRSVVEIEQPIHLELLYKRVGEGMPAGRASLATRTIIDEVISSRMQGEVTVEDQFVRLTSLDQIRARSSKPGSPDRAIEHIAIPEIADAMEQLLRGAFGVERSVLCAEAARVFGFERTGQKIRQRTNEAVDSLVRAGRITIFDDKIQLVEE